MAWKLDFSPRALKALKRIDQTAAGTILSGLERIAGTDDPRSEGRALTGHLRGLWRYRFGDYRVICDIIDDSMVIFAVRIGHRRDVYRR